MPWWKSSDRKRDIGHLGAQAKLVQASGASKKLEAPEEDVRRKIEGKHGKLVVKGTIKTPDPAPDDTATDEQIFGYFQKVGLDYKGQIQSCYDVRGKAVEASVSIDPGQVFLPGTTCSVDVKAKVANARETLLVLAVCGKTNNEEPICFATMLGAFVALSVGVEAEVGFKAPEVLPEIPEGLSEVASWQLEAKATANAGASYAGEYLHLSDPAPRFYKMNESGRIRQDFAHARSGDTNKALAKKAACAFCDQYKEIFGSVSYDSFFGGHVGSSKLIRILENGIIAIHEAAGKERRQLLARDERIVADAEKHISDLQPFLESFPFREYCSLKLWGHQGAASASVSASAKFEAKMEVGGVQSATETVGVDCGEDTEVETPLDERLSVGAGISAEARATAIELSGSIKKTIYRYQCLTYVKGPKSGTRRQLVMTQDTSITYRQAAVGGLKLSVGVSGTANAWGHGAEGGVMAELQPEWARAEYNAISYVSGVVYWHPDEKTPEIFDLGGTGYAFGQSCSLNNVKALGTFEPTTGAATLKTDSATMAYIKALAARLRVTPDQLTTFLKAGGLTMAEILTYDPNVNPSAVLIEASFSSLPTLAWRKTARGATTNQIADFRDTMIKAGAASRERDLEAIRLRYRIADEATNDKSEFKLGFKVLGNGAGIEISSVDRAGSQGIVDLATVWFNRLEKYNGIGKRLGGAGDGTEYSSVTAYESAVPPVAMICQ